ncbi:MAG: ribosome maturation factor RimP [Clostridiales bacterium]|uniref:ribosome maturation factor RimP n=1 Tax=Clostridium sp. N3C TaxID=1776758 RepID=UPI00092E14E6|nr:ribosome maturation factor RimP [Clostridium sp. N3C]NLZ48199.1 ribosome maturation factor RimP [Clostridiales bacterium]SCN21920.1 Ribosome maturation factor RimP [Clostridium sp. N3C]
MKKQVLLEKLNKLIEPIVVGLGYELYHIEYKKEDGEYYLRVYIDKEGGISLSDCEKVSRPISDMLDVEDPISDSYYLEVSSPGIFRELFNDKHLEKHIGDTVKIVFNGVFNGAKSLIGNLKSFDNDNIYISIEENEVIVPREKIKSISLEGSLKEGNTNE